MGSIARTVLESGGSVFGVTVESLMQQEVEGAGIGELKVVQNLHDRKATMAAEADAFIAMPGG
jgi:predicted Rossmann-fold nucleotide-binding protein